MRVQHNITAMNSYRNYTSNNSKLSKNLEKLSSGYAINRAGDNAAGLAISEKMRAQITGLDVAQKNANDGISLVQTAEGALTEVHDMLNRMYELAEQSANGTYESSVDRTQLQKEVNQLRTEINRIADSANFNGINLLDGNLSAAETENTDTQIQTLAAGGAETNGSKTGHITDLDTTLKTVSGATSFQEATGDKFTADLTDPGDKFVRMQIGFTAADGQKYTLSLASKTVGASAAVEDVAKALGGAISKGIDFSLASTAETAQKEALKALQDTFDFSNDGTKLIFTVKDPAGEGSVSTVNYEAKSGALPTDTELTAGSKAITKEDGLGAGYSYTFGTSVKAGDTFSVGDRVYEFADKTTDTLKNKGATRVLIKNDESTDTSSTAVAFKSQDALDNLVSALKADGYSVEKDTALIAKYAKTGAGEVTNDDGYTAIRFTDLGQISETQSGAAVSTSSDKLAILDQKVSNQKVSIDTAQATANDTDYTLTLTYVDENGVNRSKDITYNSGSDGATVSATVANNIMNALKDDADLYSMFDIAIDKGDNAKVNIVSKSSDNSVSQLVGVQTNDNTADKGIDNVTYTAGLADGKTIELKDPENYNVSAGDSVTVNGQKYEFALSSSSEVSAGSTRVILGSTGKESLKNLSKALTADGIVNSYDDSTGKITMADKDNAPEAKGGLTLQIGDTSADYNQLKVSIQDMHAGSIGIYETNEDGSFTAVEGKTIADIDISTQDGAAEALDIIKNAINMVSDVRGTLGATQNRLEHTISNLSVMQENLQNAESVIRDTDVADEMMTYTKNSILNQSAQAMLAQANQLPQGVLQLLQ